MNKLEVLRAIHAGGLVRDLGAVGDFAAFLKLLDLIEVEGLIEGVERS